jgi:hypothetical protein
MVVSSACSNGHSQEARMAHKSSEGNDEQRRAKAREARAAGKRPSEMSGSLGASKQTKKAKSNASHQERLEQRDEGKSAKVNPGRSSKPRPGNRDTDMRRAPRLD